MSTARGDDVTLGVIVGHVLRRWKLVAGVMAAVVIGVGAYAVSLPSQYQGKVVLSFSPRPSVAVGSDVVRILLPKYVAYATARSTANKIGPGLGESGATVAKAVDATTTSDSGNLTIMVTLTSAERSARVANAMADAVLQFSDQDRLLEAVIVAPALPDSSPSGPPRKLYIAAALLMGALLGVIAAFILERGRPRIRDWRDVSLITGLRVLGRLPASKTFKNGALEAMDDPAVGAAIRTLRTNLERASQDRPVHSLMVTSALSGEGKTTVASALAVSLARLDASVLLVDADLRRPSIGRTWGIESKVGLSQVLLGEASLEKAAVQSALPKLHILATQADPTAGDLLALRFVDFLRHASDSFDVVVVDAPPVLGTDDARTLATLCNGVLLVVAADTLTSSVTEAATALEGLKAPMLGAIANRTRDSRLLGSYGTYGSQA